MKENGGLFAKLAKTKLMLLIAGGAGSLFSMFITLFPLFIAVLLVLGLLDGDGGSSANGKKCYTTKTVDEICKSITVTGYGDMSVDEYVAGVVEHEYGSANIEVKKALAIAARSYGISGATKDGNGNCVIGDTGESFQTYSATPSDTSTQAAEETSGLVLVDESGNVQHSEYSSCSLQKTYNSSGETLLMSERDYKVSKDKFDKYTSGTACTVSSMNSVSKNNKDWNNRTVYGSGHGRGMGQVLASYLVAEENYDYEKLIEFFYGEESTYNWSLASSDGTTSKCDSSYNGNFQALSSYNLGHEGLTILNRTLTSDEKSELDDYINSEIDKAGYGTGAGVAAAGQSLTYGLEQMGYYLGYCWGGDRSSVGVSQSWGSRSSSCNSPQNTHNYYGMDCSGFVDWAIRNACNSSFGGNTTYDLDLGPHIDVTEAKPGDLMLNASSHVRLVLKNNGDGTVITAEEGGSVGDLNFSKHGNESGYNFIDMSSYYSNNCQSTNPSTGSKSS